MLINYKVLKNQANNFVSNFSVKFGKDYFLSEAQIKKQIDDLISSGNFKFKFPVNDQQVSEILKLRNIFYLMPFKEKINKTV